MVYWEMIWYESIGSMYMSQSNEDSIQLLNERIEKVTKEIEKTTVWIWLCFWYTRYKYNILKRNIKNWSLI